MKEIPAMIWQVFFASLKKSLDFKNKEMVFIKGVKNIQVATYNDARTVYDMGDIYKIWKKYG